MFSLLSSVLLVACRPQLDFVILAPASTPASTPSWPEPKVASEQVGASSTIDCDRSPPLVPLPDFVSPKDYANRHGATATRFSEVRSTREWPLEECGIKAGVDRLRRLTCNDGSNPFVSHDHAHRSHVGDIGIAGRCGNIVDLYRVPCPESTYEVHVDSYICVTGSTPMQ